MPLPYKSSKRRRVPIYRTTKVYVQHSLTARQRELAAQQGTDPTMLRIAEKNRYMSASDARRLVKVVNSDKMLRSEKSK